MNVLDHDDVQRSRFAELAQYRIEEFVAGGRGAAQLEKLTTKRAREVEQWPKRAGREKAVAGSPGPTGIRHVALKLLHQRRLADARLPGDKHQPPLAVPRLVRVLGERG